MSFWSAKNFVLWPTNPSQLIFVSKCSIWGVDPSEGDGSSYIKLSDHSLTTLSAETGLQGFLVYLGLSAESVFGSRRKGQLGRMTRSSCCQGPLLCTTTRRPALQQIETSKTETKLKPSNRNFFLKQIKPIFIKSMELETYKNKSFLYLERRGVTAALSVKPVFS